MESQIYSINPKVVKVEKYNTTRKQVVEQM